MTNMDDDLRGRIGALYGLPPEEFVAARDELVKELRAQSADADAAAVKRRKRPSVAAWALDQLSSSDPAGIRELLDAGAALRAAQQRAQAKSDEGQLREATDARRAAVARLADEAATILLDVGRSPDAHLDEIAATLEAASADHGVAEQLRAGMLERTVSRAVGFEGLTGLRAVEESGSADHDAEAREERAHEDVAREQLGRLRKEHQDSEQASSKADADVERLRGRVAAAQEHLALERDALREAETLARGAKLDARRAEKELEQAEARARRRGQH
jgi:hypothetical protein